MPSLSCTSMISLIDLTSSLGRTWDVYDDMLALDGILIMDQRPESWIVSLVYSTE